MSGAMTTLWRPVGQAELDLIRRPHLQRRPRRRSSRSPRSARHRSSCKLQGAYIGFLPTLPAAEKVKTRAIAK